MRYLLKRKQQNNNIYSLKNLSVRKVTGKLIDYQNDICVWGGWFVRAGGNVGLFL